MSQPFVGRDVDRGELERAIRAAAAGHGGTVLIGGEPGIGKTSLAEVAAATARDLGFAVHWASCWEGEGSPAYWPWIQILRAYAQGAADADLVVDLGAEAAEIARLVPELGRRAGAPAASPADDSEHARFRVFDAVASVVRRASARAPMLLVLDDLHWADRSSLSLLAFLTRELRSCPGLVLGTYRDLEVAEDRAAAEALARVARNGRVLTLTGLTVEDVGAIVGAAGGGRDPALASAVHERSGGNPLFAQELVRLLVSQGRVGTAADPASIRVPDGVRPVIERRLARVSQSCQDMLAHAAVAGRGFSADVVAAASARSRDEVTSALDEAIGARLVEPAGVGRYRFAHALIREALYDSLSASRRSAAHLAVGEALESAAGEVRPAELAFHFVRAVETSGGVKAVEYSRRAGLEAIAQTAYVEAAGHFERAIEALPLTGGPDEHRGELLLSLGDARLRAGDLPGARACFLDASEEARASGDPDRLARAALGFGAGLGGFEVKMLDQTQIDLLEEALGALPPGASSLRAWLLARLSVASFLVAPDERRRELAEAAVRMAREIGDASALAHALAAHCDSISGPDGTEQRLAESTEIIRLADGAGNPPMQLLGRRLRLVALLELGDVNAADIEIDLFERTAAALRQPLYQWYVPLWRAMRAQMDGRFDEAARLVEQAERIGMLAHSDNARMLTVVNRFVCAYERGDGPEVALWLDRLEQTVPYFPTQYRTGIRLALHPAPGPREAADANRLAAGGLDWIPFDGEWIPASCLVADGVINAGDPESARLLYRTISRWAHRHAIDGIGAGTYGSVARHAGRLAHRAGDLEAALGHLRDAIAADRASGSPLFTAHSKAAYAAALVDRDAPGDAELARSMLAEAAEAYRALGLDDLASAAEGPLRDATTSAGGRPHAATPGAGAFRRDGEMWTLAFGGTVVHMKDVKGLHDIARLLAADGTEVHALDLMTVPAPASRTSGGDATPSVEGDAGAMLDERSRTVYRQRIAELDEEIETAGQLSDPARAERARAERDAIVEQLSGAFGLGGRPRRAKDPAERARSAVTWRIRDAIARIERVHPALGKHLRRSVSTGTYCRYDPVEPVVWDL